MKTLSAVACVLVSAAACAAGVSRPGLRNPERGWRFSNRVGIEENERDSFRDHWPFARYAYDGVTVSQAYCYLTKYNHAPLPQSKLDALQADFDRARKDGVKFLLRFAYEKDMSCKEGPCLHDILGHIAQLKGIVRRNADVIYCLQIGWVGAWGEYHCSMSQIEKDPKKSAQVVAATLDMLPPNRKTMMRTPLRRNEALRELGGRGAELIGLFNDATLANGTDSGTFVGIAASGDKEFDLMKQVGEYAPIDGELFWTFAHVAPERETALRAILRFKEHHYTTFSLVHSFSELDRPTEPGAIDRWKKTPVTQEMLEAYGIDCDPDYFAGAPYRTGFEFIRDHLGYRLVAKGAKVEDGVARVTIRNYGFAAPVNPRKAHFAVLKADGGVVTAMTDFDCTKLAAGKDTEIAGRVPAMAEGDRLALWLPDEMMPERPEYAIRLAGGVEIVEQGGKVLNVVK